MDLSQGPCWWRIQTRIIAPASGAGKRRRILASLTKRDRNKLSDKLPPARECSARASYLTASGVSPIARPTRRSRQRLSVCWIVAEPPRSGSTLLHTLLSLAPDNMAAGTLDQQEASPVKALSRWPPRSSRSDMPATGKQPRNFCPTQGAHSTERATFHPVDSIEPTRR